MSARARAEELRERGFSLVKGLLPPAQVERYTRALERLSGRARESFESFRVGQRLLRRGLYHGWTLPDGISKTRELWDVIFHLPLLAAVREALGGEACYLQHSDLHVGISAVTWHRDSVNRRYGAGPDWDEQQEPYRLLRVGIYLQSFAESRFSLGLISGSHRLGTSFDGPEGRVVERRTGWLGQAVALVTGTDPLASGAAWVGAESGDAILFDPRILHAGSFISGPKYSLFLAYGVPGRHFARHQAYYRHVRPELRYEALHPELVARLRNAQLLAQNLPEVESARAAYVPSFLQTRLVRKLRVAQTGR